MHFVMLSGTWSMVVFCVVAMSHVEHGGLLCSGYVARGAWWSSV